MNIQEAVKMSMETKKKIIHYGIREGRLLIEPTNTENCCILIKTKDGKEVSRRARWQPSADELLSNNYELANE